MTYKEAIEVLENHYACVNSDILDCSPHCIECDFNVTEGQVRQANEKALEALRMAAEAKGEIR